MQRNGFFVFSEAGCYWTGSDWTADVERAQRFGFPEYEHPWKACYEVCVRLMAETGLVCCCLYRLFARKPARKSSRHKRRSILAPSQRPICMT